jgi:hypothetical protein
MKKKSIVSLIVAFCFVITLLSGSVPVQAATKSATSQIKKLSKQMNSYEEYVLWCNKNFTKKAKTIKLTNAQKAIAAAFTIKVTDEDAVGEGRVGTNAYFKIKDSQLKKKSKNLFGKALGVKYLRKISSEDGLSWMDAYRRTDGTAIVYYEYAENEYNYDVRKTTIKKNEDGSYTLTKKIYYGYWLDGDVDEDGNSNYYKVTYRVVKNDDSQYGYVIKSMTIKRI